jgi:hypothetical protein
MNFENDEFAWIWILILVIVLLLIVKAVPFLADFRRESKYLRMERGRAYSQEEYDYWNAQLKRHYLRLIPFIKTKRHGR